MLSDLISNLQTEDVPDCSVEGTCEEVIDLAAENGVDMDYSRYALHVLGIISAFRSLVPDTLGAFLIWRHINRNDIEIPDFRRDPDCRRRGRGGRGGGGGGRSRQEFFEDDDGEPYLTDEDGDCQGRYEQF